MQVEVHNQLRSANRIDATRVVVYDIFDNPIAVVIEVEPGRYVAATAGHKKFHQILEAMGINKTLIVDRLDTTKLKVLE